MRSRLGLCLLIVSVSACHGPSIEGHWIGDPEAAEAIVEPHVHQYGIRTAQMVELQKRRMASMTATFTSDVVAFASNEGKRVMRYRIEKRQGRPVLVLLGQAKDELFLELTDKRMVLRSQANEVQMAFVRR